MAEEVGRPTVLDDKLLTKIRDLVLDGHTLQDIAQIIEVPWGTVKDWNYRNYEGFSDKLLSYKHERLINKAESNVEVLLSSEDERVGADMTKFTLETLAKQRYSKRSELTGKDGETVVTTIQIIKPNEDSNLSTNN